MEAEAEQLPQTLPDVPDIPGHPRATALMTGLVVLNKIQSSPLPVHPSVPMY